MRSLGFALLLMVALVSPAWGQDKVPIEPVPEDRAPGPPHFGEPDSPDQPGPREVGAPHRPRVGAHRQGPRGGPPLEVWLQHLAERDPAEYERLSRIREESPGDFKRELRQRLRRERVRDRLEAMPRIYNFLMSLPESDRKELLGELGSLTLRRGDRGADRADDTPNLRAREEEVRRLSREYQAADGQDKDQLRERIRGKVQELFDLREQRRAAHIAKLEEQLQRLKSSAEKRHEHRDAVIERRVQELTEGDPTTW